MKHIKVALISDWYLPRVGGLELHLRDLAKNLNARGHEAHIICATPGPLSQDGPRVHRLDQPLMPVLHTIRSRDALQPLWRILPEFCAQQPRYERVGLRDLCQQIHDMYKANDVARVTTEMYLSEMQPAMKPSDAFACMAHREIDRVEIDDLEGRVTAVLLTPYPPGIPLLIPGERFNRTIVEYLKFARTFNDTFPGFETDIHGLVEIVDGGRKRYFMDCVRQRNGA